MKNLICSKTSASGTGWRVGRLALTVAVFTLPAFAALGGSLDSVFVDQAHMNATLTITEAGFYSVHELTSPNGTVVREYVSAEGRVFGVAWEGPFVPNMRQLLGSYFEHYSNSAKAQRQSHVERRPLDIREPGLVLQTAGHMRAYFGRAYDPELLPSGVNPDEVR